MKIECSRGRPWIVALSIMGGQPLASGGCTTPADELTTADSDPSTDTDDAPTPSGGMGPHADSAHPGGADDTGASEADDTQGAPEPDTGDTSAPSPCPALPQSVGYMGAQGERENCGIPHDSASPEAGPCQDRTLPGTGLEYCVRANPACAEKGAGCFAVITFNMGPKGLSQTIGGRVNKPQQFGRFVAVGGGTSADTEQMIELPQALRQEFPGIDPDTIYVLGNSAGNGAISNMLADPAAASQYAAAAVLAGGIKVPDDYAPPNNLHVIFFNGKDDVEMPNGLREIAAANGCEDPEAPWENITSADPYVPRGDCSDIAERLAAGPCTHGDVLAYRFKDEGHDSAGYDQHFDPRVRPMKMAFDFFVGRALAGGLVGAGSACWK